MSGEPREAPSPSAYRAKNPYQPPPRDYKPPSLLSEHKGLAILFTAVLVGFVGFGWNVLHHVPARPAASSAEQRAAAARFSTPSSAPEPSAALAAPHSVSHEAPSRDSPSPAPPIYIQAIPDEDSH